MTQDKRYEAQVLTQVTQVNASLPINTLETTENNQQLSELYGSDAKWLYKQLQDQENRRTASRRNFFGSRKEAANF